MHSVPSTSSLESYLTLSSSSMLELVRILNETNFERANEELALRGSPLVQSPQGKGSATGSGEAREKATNGKKSKLKESHLSTPFLRRLGAMGRSLSGRASSFRLSMHSLGNSDHDDGASGDNGSSHSKTPSFSARGLELTRALSNRLLHKSKESLELPLTQKSEEKEIVILGDHDSILQDSPRVIEVTSRPAFSERIETKVVEVQTEQVSPEPKSPDQKMMNILNTEDEPKSDQVVVETATYESSRKVFEALFKKDQTSATVSPKTEDSIHEKAETNGFGSVDERLSSIVRRKSSSSKKYEEKHDQVPPIPKVAEDLMKKANLNINPKKETETDKGNFAGAHSNIINKRRLRSTLSKRSLQKPDVPKKPKNDNCTELMFNAPLPKSTVNSAPLKNSTSQSDSSGSSWIKRSSTALFPSRGRKSNANSSMRSIPSLTKISSLFNGTTTPEASVDPECAFSPRDQSSADPGLGNLRSLRAPKSEQKAEEEKLQGAHRWRVKLRKSVFRTKKPVSGVTSYTERKPDALSQKKSVRRAKSHKEKPKVQA